MALTAGAKVGPYEILSRIGLGGMGEVYKARDTRLNRLVAIKLLHSEVEDRADRRARFELEARAVSSLSHPNICPLFDLGEQDGRAFLVMEYLEGETLDDRLVHGALPAADVVRYGAALADALHHAHTRRVIHRDVKPSNVMLTATGPKLLDFGLARSHQLEASPHSVTASLDDRKLTAEGTLIGTFQYMAPEQLEGKAVDPRTDVFALGTVLYEMATGRRAFNGSSQASLIASILTEHPPSISSTRLAIDAGGSLLALDHVVERCLAKHPDERWQTARDLKLELEWIGKGRSLDRMAAPATKRLRPREAVAWALAVIAVAAAVVIAAGRFSDNGRQRTEFTVSLPPGATIPSAESRTRLALSPDGRRLAIVAFTDGTQQLWIRSLDSLAAQPVPNTIGAISPFWSPDSRFLGFFSPGDGTLKKVEIAGGPVRTISSGRVDGVPTWGLDGTILFTQFLDGIYRVSADGGTPTRLTKLDKSKRELNHYWPEFLPGGRHFLYMATALEESGLRATPSVYVGSFDSSDTTLLTRQHSRMTYADPGYLLFVENGVLLAQRFDTSRRQLVGEPAQITAGVGYVRTVGNAAFSVSSNGVLAFQVAGNESNLVWADRRGEITETGWATQNYGSFRFSPDGQRVLVDVVDPGTNAADLWIYDTARGAPVRLTSDAADESGPLWSPDMMRVLFRSDRGGPASLRIGSAAPNLYVKDVATGSEEIVVVDPTPLLGEDWSPDGRWVSYTKTTQKTGLDIWLMSLTDGGKPQPFSNERFDESGSSFSPDSRWIAYTSTEAGSPEVYVAPVGKAGERKRISTAGGTSPRWRRDGTELYYAAPDGLAMFRVPIRLGPTIDAGAPTRLFAINASTAARFSRRNIVYDVTPDGQRFLINLVAEDPSSSRVTVVLNWLAALGK
jgi:serine/threonine protein kinase